MDAAGGFVVASEAGDIVATKIVVNRLDAAGNLDMGFGAPTFDPTPGLGSLPEDIVMQPDGGILVVGISYVEPFPKSFEYGKLDVIRLLPGGQPDASFGPGGIRVFSGPQGGAMGFDGTLDRAGRLLVSGMSFVYPPQSPYTDDALVARILTMPPAPPPVPIASARATIKFAGFKRNRRKGTGTLFVVVSKAGTIKLAGTKKLRGFSTKAGKAGKFALKVRARGKARKRLLALADRRGLARLKALAKVSYLPSGEASLTLQRRVKLVKRG